MIIYKTTNLINGKIYRTNQKISENNARFWQGKNIPEETKEKIRKKRINQDMFYRYAHHILIDEKDYKHDVGCATESREKHGMSKTQYYRLIRGEIKKYKGFYLQKQKYML